jgi:predicted RNA-binding Zn-ribbon protein involved in translation (DUF1610 family)
MEIVENGPGWSMTVSCTGNGNGGGGCKSKLKINKEDLYITSSHHYDDSSESYITFTCPQCGIETDVGRSKIPSGISDSLPKKADWLLGLRMGESFKDPVESNFYKLLMCVSCVRALASQLEDQLDCAVLPTDIIDFAEDVVANTNQNRFKEKTPELVKQLKGE